MTNTKTVEAGERTQIISILDHRDRLMLEKARLLSLVKRIVGNGYLRPGKHQDVHVHPEIITEAAALIASMEPTREAEGRAQ